MEKLIYFDYVETDKERFFFSPQYNSLFKVILETGRVVLEKQLREKFYGGAGYYLEMDDNHENIVLFPLEGNSIAVYSIRNKDFTYFPLLLTSDIRYKFWNSVRINHKVIAIPGRYEAFVIMDCLNRKKTEIKYDLNILNYGEVKEKSDVCFSKSFYQDEKSVYVASAYSNYIVEMKADTEELVYHKIELAGKKKGIHSICGNGKIIYLIDNNNTLYTYSISKGTLTLINRIPESLLNSVCNAYTLFVYWNERLLLFIPGSSCIIQYSLSDNCFEKTTIDCEDEVSHNIFDMIGFAYVKYSSDFLYFMNTKNYTEYVLDKNFNLVVKKNYYISCEEKKKLRPYKYSFESGLGGASLQGFLDLLMQDTDYCEEEMNEKG